jgi:NADH dehydrogenase
MLPEVASSAIDPRHITPALRATLRSTSFAMGEVTHIDVNKRTVAVRPPGEPADSTLPYDQVVVAVGAENTTHGVPGAAEHTLPFKRIADAIALRDAAITSLERAATTTHDASDKHSPRSWSSAAASRGWKSQANCGLFFGRLLARIRTSTATICAWC